jgi:hypothetical protein
MNHHLAQFDGQLLDGLEFCNKVYTLFELIRSQPDGVERIRLRPTITEKRLMEELLPICRYVQTYYRLGRYLSVRWVNGSQSYDAELHQHGWYVTQGYVPSEAYLEATCAMHENEHWIRKLLHGGQPAYAPEGIKKQKGKPVESTPISFTGTEHVTGFAPLLVSLIRKKSEIEYPANTSLVVQCHLNSLYTPEEWRLLVSTVEGQVKSTRFREVLLFDGTTALATPLSLFAE